MAPPSARRSGKHRKPPRCPLCAAKKVKSILQLVTLAPGVRIRVCPRNDCEYPLTDEVRSRIRLSSCRRTPREGKPSDGNSYPDVSGIENNISDYDWLNELPLDTVSYSDGTSNASASGFTSPADSPARVVDGVGCPSPLPTIEELLQTNGEQFLPIGFFGANAATVVGDGNIASPASIIDDDDALFAALRHDPRSVLQVSEARLASRGASPAPNSASDVEVDKEGERIGSFEPQVADDLMEIFANGVQEHVETASSVIVANPPDLDKTLGLFNGTSSAVPAGNVEGIQDPAPVNIGDQQDGKSDGSPEVSEISSPKATSSLRSSIPCDTNEDTADSLVRNRKKLKKRRDLDASSSRIRHLSSSSTSSSSRSSVVQRSFSDNSSSSLSTATSCDSRTVGTASFQPPAEEASSWSFSWSEEIPRPTESVAKKVKADVFMTLSDGVSSPPVADARTPNAELPSATDLFGDVTDGVLEEDTKASSGKKSLGASTALGTHSDVSVPPGDNPTLEDLFGDLEGFEDGGEGSACGVCEDDESLGKEITLTGTSENVAEKSDGLPSSLERRPEEGFLSKDSAFLSMYPLRTSTTPITSPTADDRPGEDEFSPVIPSDASDKEDDNAGIPAEKCPGEVVERIVSSSTASSSLFTAHARALPPSPKIDGLQPKMAAEELEDDPGKLEVPPVVREFEGDSMKLPSSGITAPVVEVEPPKPEGLGLFADVEEENEMSEAADRSVDAVQISLGEEGRVAPKASEVIDQSGEEAETGFLMPTAIVKTYERRRISSESSSSPPTTSNVSKTRVLRARDEPQPQEKTGDSNVDSPTGRGEWNTDEGNVEEVEVVNLASPSDADSTKPEEDEDFPEPFVSDEEEQVENVQNPEATPLVAAVRGGNSVSQEPAGVATYAELAPIPMTVGEDYIPQPRQELLETAEFQPLENPAALVAGPVSAFEKEDLGDKHLFNMVEEIAQADVDNYVGSSSQFAHLDALVERRLDVTSDNSEKSRAQDVSPATVGDDGVAAASPVTSPLSQLFQGEGSLDSGICHAGEECRLAVRVEPDVTPDFGLFEDAWYPSVFDGDDEKNEEPAAGAGTTASSSSPGMTLKSIEALADLNADVASMPGAVPREARLLFGQKILRVEDRTRSDAPELRYIMTPLPTDKKFTATLAAPPATTELTMDNGLRLVFPDVDPNGVDQVTRIVKLDGAPGGGGGFCASMNDPVDGRMNALLLKPVGYTFAEDDREDVLDGFGLAGDAKDVKFFADSSSATTSGRGGHDGRGSVGSEDRRLGSSPSASAAASTAGCDEGDGRAEADLRSECSRSTAVSSTPAMELVSRDVILLTRDGDLKRRKGPIPLGAVLKERRSIDVLVYECPDGTRVQERSVYRQRAAAGIRDAVDFEPPGKRARRNAEDDGGGGDGDWDEDEDEEGEDEALPWSRKWTERERRRMLKKGYLRKVGPQMEVELTRPRFGYPPGEKALWTKRMDQKVPFNPTLSPRAIKRLDARRADIMKSAMEILDKSERRLPVKQTNGGGKQVPKATRKKPPPPKPPSVKRVGMRTRKTKKGAPPDDDEL